MTGRIEQLATPDGPGVITTKTGRNTFRYSYELGSAEKGLQVGRLVAFELQKGNVETAVKVSPADSGEYSHALHTGIPEIRYEGFEQKNDIRFFRFRAWRMGEENQDIVVTADLALFRRYGITIQEGPGLCSRVVETELQQSSRMQSGVLERKLTADDMMAHVAQHRNGGKKRG